MNRQQISKNNFERVLQDENQYNFPAFLLELRRALGLNRKVVAHDLGIDYQRLVHMESPRLFRNKPKIDVMMKLSEYYGIDSKIIIEKAIRFLAKTREL